MILTYIIETTVYGVKAYHWKCSCNARGRAVDRESQALRSAQKHIDKFHANAEVSQTKIVNPA